MNLEAFMYLEERKHAKFYSGKWTLKFYFRTMFVQLNGKKKEIKQGGEVVNLTLELRDSKHDYFLV